MGISNEDRDQGGVGPHYILPLTDEMVETVKSLPIVKYFEKDEMQPDSSGQVFPYSKYFPWSRDNYGPLWIPKAGVTVDLSLENLLLYERIITSYEGNKLEVKGETIYINGQPTNSYTFNLDYYFMIGDNRHKSADSRYWGFVPEDHIVGRPLLVWLSLNKDKSFPANIRWNRFFKMVKGD
jgi:signal peptidase I